MSGKTEKKIRQLQRKQVNHKLNELVDSVSEKMRHIHKPAPKWIPKRLWRWLGRQFLNI